MDIVLLTFGFILTVYDGHKVLSGDVLKRFRTTDIASVCVDSEQGLYFGYTGDDSADSDEFA